MIILKRSLLILSFIASPAVAEEAKITSSEVTIQSPCKEVGYFKYPVCVVKDITFIASAPRTELKFDLRSSVLVGSRFKEYAVIYKYRTSPKLKNKDGVISVWTHDYDFIAEYISVENTVVTIGISTESGGKSWSKYRSNNKGVSFSLDY